jgi:hypothetical protein
MKALMATIALLCLSSTILAHDIYTNLRDRDGNPCCGGEDCMPVEATVLPDGNYYLPASGEIIPADMATPSPDDRFHRCTYPHLAPIANEFDRWPAWKSIPETRCFFAPMHSTWPTAISPGLSLGRLSASHRRGRADVREVGQIAKR